MYHYSKKKQLFYKKKMVDAEEKANGNNVGSQEQKRELSPNLAQSSALAEAKRFQIATECLVSMNSTSSHYIQLAYKKVVFIKKICYTLL